MYMCKSEYSQNAVGRSGRKIANLEIWELAMIFSGFAGSAPWTQDRQGTLNPSKPWWSRVPPAIFLGPKIAKVSLDLTLREGPSEDEDWSL